MTFPERSALLALLLLFAAAALAPAQSGTAPAGDRLAVPRPPRLPAASAAGSAKAPDEPTFKVDVKLVNVFATVLDSHGAPVGGLKKEDFRILEDGFPQQISVFERESQLPLSIVLAVDTSLSTHKDLPLELNSARRFAHIIMRPVDRLAVYEFSETVHEVAGFTADLKQIDRAIVGIRPGTATAMYDAIYLGAEALERRQGRKVLVIITDGGDTISKLNYQDALRAAEEAEAIVYSIIVVPIAASAGRDLGGEHALIQLASDTGGKYYYADSLPHLDQAFDRISEELRTQYLLAYYPTRRLADSDFRRIEVEVRGEGEAGLTVRHRTGYYTSKR
jgi:Ca-activated chloride channel family protein